MPKREKVRGWESDLGGVYKITNLENGKVYIGSTSQSFRKRWHEHRTKLHHGKHVNHHLQGAWKRYGEKAFSFSILEVVDNPRQAIECEQKWLDFHASQNDVYNIAKIVENPMMGRKHTLETRKKISEALKGEKHPGYGKPLSPELRQAISVRQTGPRNSFYGKTHTEESRKKMGLPGKNNPSFGRRLTTEQKRGLAEALGMPYPAFYNVRTGETIPAGKNRSALCGKRGLHVGAMGKVIKGNYYSHKGWVLADKARRKKLEQRGKLYPAFYNEKTKEITPAGTSLRFLCKEKGLEQGNMWAVMHGKTRSCKGWILAKNPKEHGLTKLYPAFYNERTGEFVLGGLNLTRFCRNRGLDSGAMYRVINGKTRMHKGWVLGEGICK